MSSASPVVPATVAANGDSNRYQPTKTEHQGQGDIDNAATTFKPSWRFLVAFSSLMLLTLMAALDGTSPSTTLPTITKALNGTSIDGFWVGTSFLLASTIMMPIYGSLSDIFGRKLMVYVAILLFGVGSVISAVAKDTFTPMLVGRSIQGAGGGGLLVLTEILITDLVPLRFRGNYLSGFAVMWSIGSVTGPIIGGVFAEKVSWRWIYWINLPLIGMALPLVVLFLRLFFKPSSLMQKLKRVDWVGMALFSGSATSFLIPITWGGTQYAWSSYQSLVPLLVGIAGLAVFALWETRFAADPMIRFRVLNNASACLAMLGNFMNGLLLWSIIYYLPLYFFVCKFVSPIQGGVDALPSTLSIAPAAAVSGVFIVQLGRYRWAIWAGWALTALGFGLRVLQDVDTSVVAWVFINIVGGIGLGMTIPSQTYALQAATTNADQAYAQTLFVFFRSAGQAVGVAVGGAVFQNAFRREIRKYVSIAPYAEEWSRDANLMQGIIRTLAGQQQEDALVAFAAALQTVWWVMTAFGLLALVTSFFIRHYDLDRALETDHGFMEKDQGRGKGHAKDEEAAEKDEQNAPESDVEKDLASESVPEEH